MTCCNYFVFVTKVISEYREFERNEDTVEFYETDPDTINVYELKKTLISKRTALGVPVWKVIERTLIRGSDWVDMYGKSRGVGLSDFD